MPSFHPTHFLMALLLVSVHCLCWWLEELSPPCPWPTQDSAPWPPETPPHPWAFGRCYGLPMPDHKPRLRGRPRRGSPWRPRRPSAPPSAQPPTCSSLRFQAEPMEHVHSLALIPRPLCSSSRIFQTPPMAAPPHTPFSALPRTLEDKNPPSSRKQGHKEHPSADTVHDEQLKDKLSILYGLVFELRQGVEDLQFRLQLNNEKVALFLQLLSSMHEAVLSDPEGATSKPGPSDDTADVEEGKRSATLRQEPGATTQGEDVTMQCAEELGMKQNGSETLAEELTSAKQQMQDTARNNQGIETSAEVEVQWGDGTTIVEEEPWTGDLQGTWPGYVSSV
jgi:hypothetical protein